MLGHGYGHRSLDQIIDQQFREWEMRNRRGRVRPRPTVTVSRLPGSGGRLYAEALAREMGFDLFDREIVQRIAESAHLSEAVVDTLDERVRPRFTEWLMMLERQRFLWPHQYLQHLTRVLGGIAGHGQAVILGRGSPFVLCRGESLRVSIVAPLDLRVRRVAREQAVDELEAHRQVTAVEAERREFIRRNFNADLTDPMKYDLVFNTEFLTIEDAVAATKATLERRAEELRAAWESAIEPASP